MSSELRSLALALAQVPGCAIDVQALQRHGNQQAASIEVVVDSVDFLIIRFDQRPGEFLLHCAFGRLPDFCREDAMRRILEINLALVGRGGAGFGLDDQTGELIYTCPAAASTDAHALFSFLAQLAGEARHWRETHFLRNARTAPLFDVMHMNKI